MKTYKLTPCPSPTPAERLRFDKRCAPHGECLLWNRPTHTGYGHFCWRYRAYGAHRLSLAWHTGGFYEELHVLHSCHNRLCVALGHLRWGTQKENWGDTRKAGRIAWGERTKSATITEATAVAIWQGWFDAKKPVTQLAEENGVKRDLVRRILSRRTWAEATRALPGVYGGRRRVFNKGSKHHRSKLDEGKVRLLRRLRGEGLLTKEARRAYAAEYGVTKECINMVARGVSWASVT